MVVLGDIGDYTAQLRGESLRGFFFVAHLGVFFRAFIHPSLLSSNLPGVPVEYTLED